MTCANHMLAGERGNGEESMQSDTLSCATDVEDVEDVETPDWICQSELESAGYQADDEHQDEEPCFFFDIEGETFWFEDDDDAVDYDEFGRW